MQYSGGLYLGSALALLACASEAGRRAPPLDFDIELTRTRLDNGLELVVVPDPSSPVATAIATFRAGAMVETADTHGYSHLLEHMMFKGSAELPDPLAFRAELRRLGALNNATTGIDRVNFFYTLPRASLRDGLALMAGALRAPALDAGALEDEIAVVLSEFDLIESVPEDRARIRLFALLHSDQPSRSHPLGTREVVSAATRDALLAMHERFYVPNNAMLVLAGGVEVEDGRRLARELFGAWPERDDPFADAPVPPPTPLDENVAEVMTAPVEHATLLIAWHAPATASAPDASVAADVLAELSVTSGHPFRGLVGAPAVLGAGVDHYDGPYGGMFVLEMRIGLGYERNVVEQLAPALRSFDAAESFEDGVLDTAVDKLWSERFHAADASTSTAHWLSNSWGAADLDYATTYVDRLYSVSAADVRAVATRHLLGQPCAAVLLTTAENSLNGRLDAGWLRGAL